MHFCFYVAYMFYAAYVLMRQDSAEGDIAIAEIFFWVWAIAREVGEFYELDEFSLGALRMYAPLRSNPPSSCTPLHPPTPPYTHPYTPSPPTPPYTPYRYIRDFWNQLDTGTFLMIMVAGAVRINNASRDQEWESRKQDWEGSFLDVPLPRNIQP